jgi:hypothetical protein
MVKAAVPAKVEYVCTCLNQIRNNFTEPNFHPIGLLDIPVSAKSHDHTITSIW